MAGVTIARCPVVVGRDVELSLIDELIRAAARGRGSALVIEGDPGMGKSRLVTEAVSRAQQHGVLSGVGRANASSAVPFRPLTEALLALTRRQRPDDPSLAPHLGVLGQLVPTWPCSDEPAEASIIAIAEAFLSVAVVAAGSSGALVVLEDLHWADDETLAIVEYVADNIALAPIGLLVSTRPTPAAASVLGRELASRGRAQHSVLRGLEVDDASEMVRRCLESSGADVSSEEIEHVVDCAGGLPLLVEDLLAAAAVRDGDGPSVALPERYAQTVRQRLATLTDDARRVIEAAAILGPVFDWRLLAPVTRLPGDRVGAGIHEAAMAQVFERDPATNEVRFRHALTSDVVVADLDPTTTQHLRMVAADALVIANPGEGDELRLLEAELRAAAGDRVRACGLFTVLATSDQRRGALRSAERHARAALDLVPDDLGARLLLLEVLVRAGRSNDSLEHGSAVLASLGLTAQERTAAELLVARAAISAGRLDVAQRHLDGARPSATVRQRAEIACLEAEAALANIDAHRLIAAEHLAHQAVAAAEVAGVPEMVCESLEIVGRCARLRDLSAARFAFVRGLHSAEEHDLVLWRIRALNELGTVDMFADADPARLLEARAAAEQAGALATVAGVDVNLAALYTMRGDYEPARAAADACVTLARRCRATGLEAAGLVFGGVVAAHEGRYGDMRRHVDAAEQLAGDDPDVIVGTWAMCRGTAALLQEKRDDAITAFARAAKAIEERPALAINPVDGPWLLLRAANGEATLTEVDAYGSSQAKGAIWSLLWERFARGIALAASGSPEEATISIDQGIAAAARLPLFSAIGLRVVGERAVADRWGRPEDWLTRAGAAFDAVGHDRPARACRDLLRRSGTRLPRPRKVDAAVPSALRAHGITAREYEVLQLVAERLTNTEIAERLYLSPRTVEKHVASLLSKSGLRDRKALATLLGD